MGFLKTVMFRSVVSVILMLCLFAGLAVMISRHRVALFDNQIVDVIRSLNSPNVTVVMKGFTTAGSGVYVTIITILIVLTLVIIGYRREMIFFVGVILCSSLLNYLLKQIFHRARPDIHRIINAAGYSFPSGHSMSAFTLYSLTIYFLWKHARRAWTRIAIVIIGLTMILMIGISRIYLGVHYPSDIIGGYLISGAWLVASISWYEHYLEERWRSKKFRSRRTSLH
ncbi:phosphatase PAP2 family protein [Paenibacillus sp. sgz302251]|uniref:phosphatase PAP2 family protein n=1 Tax=Paenibacillus sp. sgz302251 TaxID=3414493 RepID=UPI003C7A037C